MPPCSNTAPVTTPADFGKAEKVWSRDDVYNSDRYAILEDGVYDLVAFKDSHPGGDDVILFVGQDATAHFYMLHQYEKLPQALQKHRVGSVVPDKSYAFHTEFTKEVRRRVREVLPLNEWWAPASWYIKTLAILAAAFYCDYYWIAKGPSMTQAVIGGVIYAWIGLNIQHDANHGAVSKNPLINRLFGYSQDYIGGSRMLWIRQHVVGHHVHCNREAHDPDISAGAALNLSQYQWPKSYMAVQDMYTGPLLHMLGLQWVFGGMVHLLTMTYKGHNLPKTYTFERNVSVGLRIFLYLRRFIIPMYLYPSWHTVWCTYVWLGMGAAYLGFFFILSHIFEEAKALPATTENVDWTKHQVESSSNLCGWRLAISNGGLNYQIEHHLFPRMSHAHYSKIAPVVKKCCEEYGVQYVHFNSIPSNVLSCLRQLKLLGTTYVASKYDTKKAQ
eukprot:comp8090_c0_seq1/m.3577 comp8090_c0_seq1/g.3577  ORF comp8090_c0_seq1/g.3577 comp8090_c0_seq1/m.3577 type:complete len:444 (-) comp8090_c0_seq1:635-1966(-)